MTVKVNMLLVPILYWGIEFESKTLIEVYYMLRFRQWQMMANSTPYGRTPPNVSTPFLPGPTEPNRSEVSDSESCFDEAENQAASSLGLGGHRYTRIRACQNSYGFRAI